MATKPYSDATNGKGTSSVVNLNPGEVSGAVQELVVTKDRKTGKMVWSVMPPTVTLAHELIHAQRQLKGVFTPFTEPPGGTNTFISPDTGKPVTKEVQIEELLTVGLWPGAWVTENAIRRELGYPARRSYVARTQLNIVVK